MKKDRDERARRAEQVLAALIAGNFTVVERDAPRASGGGICDGHGGIDWCDESICVCNDGHVFIIRVPA